MKGHVVRLPDGREATVIDTISDTITNVYIKKDGLTNVHPDHLENVGWVMPEWMEEYRDILKGFTGGDTIEGVMNDHTSTIDINAPRAMICVSLKSAVWVLERLHKEGKI